MAVPFFDTLDSDTYNCFISKRCVIRVLNVPKKTQPASTLMYDLYYRRIRARRSVTGRDNTSFFSLCKNKSSQKS